MLYTETKPSSSLIKVVDHYENPRNVGSLDKKSKNVGTGLVGAPACGDVMKLQVYGKIPFSFIHRLTVLQRHLINTHLLVQKSL